MTLHRAALGALPNGILWSVQKRSGGRPGSTRAARSSIGRASGLSSVSRINLMLWFAVLVLSPIYILSPGAPQPFHILAAVLAIGTAFIWVPKVIGEDLLLLPLFGFVVHVMAVNLVWFGWIQHPDFLMSFLYVAFNAVLFLCVLGCCRRFGAAFVSTTRAALMCALVLELLVVVSGLGAQHPSGGELGTFSNPNQLAYWSLSVLVLLSLAEKGRTLTVVDAVAVGIVLVLCVASLSRANMASVLMVVGLLLLMHRKNLPVRTCLVVALAGAAVVAAVGGTELVTESDLVTSTSAEMARRTPYDSLEGRGYDRLWNFPEYLWLGAGEGAFARFAVAPLYFANEIHSSFANIVFSYGIIGFMLFLAFLIRVLHKLDWAALLYLLPLFVVGLTHNTFRNSMLWIVLAVAYGTAKPQAGQRTRAWINVNSADLRRFFIEKRLRGLERFTTIAAFRRQHAGGSGPGEAGAASGSHDAPRRPVAHPETGADRDACAQPEAAAHPGTDARRAGGPEETGGSAGISTASPSAAPEEVDEPTIFFVDATGLAYPVRKRHVASQAGQHAGGAGRREAAARVARGATRAAS